jgi:hypothetical protein
MPEKLKDKIKKLEFQLSDELRRVMELYETVRSQSEKIDLLVQYIIAKGLAHSAEEAFDLAQKSLNRKKHDKKAQTEFEF